MINNTINGSKLELFQNILQLNSRRFPAALLSAKWRGTMKGAQVKQNLDESCRRTTSSKEVAQLLTRLAKEFGEQVTPLQDLCNVVATNKCIIIYDL